MEKNNGAKLNSENFVFCFCLPLNEQDVKNDLKNENKDFIKNVLFSGDSFDKFEFEDKYVNQVIKPYYDLKRNFNAKFTFLENVTFKDYCEIIENQKFKVVILFTHCQEKIFIEFYDRLIHYQEVINRIPKNCCKFLDFSACSTTEKLGMDIDLSRECIVRTDKKKLPIRYWLYAYRVIFNIILSKKAETYPQAFTIFFSEIFEMRKKILTKRWKKRSIKRESNWFNKILIYFNLKRNTYENCKINK